MLGRWSCCDCIHWIDATAECAVARQLQADGSRVPEDIIAALDGDPTVDNDCLYFDV